MRRSLLAVTTLGLLALACSSDPEVSPPERTTSAPEHDDGGDRAGDAAEPDEPSEAEASGLQWPIDCIPDETCEPIGYPDVDGDNVAFDCSTPFIEAHEGTDIPVSDERAAAGVEVYAADDGEVLWVFDGRFDACPNDAEPECQEPAELPAPGMSEGTTVCTPLGPYCPGGADEGDCYWCFAGGNVVVIRHRNTAGVFATRYDHFRKNSILVTPGDMVKAGDKLGLVGSAGNSTRPHLHFEVWGETYYDPVEPFAGECGPNTDQSLWAHVPPWPE